MKKFLVILLLLFPFYGVWGIESCNIRLNVKGAPSVYFEYEWVIEKRMYEEACKNGKQISCEILRKTKECFARNRAELEKNLEIDIKDK